MRASEFGTAASRLPGFNGGVFGGRYYAKECSCPMLPKTAIAAGMHAMPPPAAFLLAAVRYILVATGQRWMAVDGAIGAGTLRSRLVHMTRI